VTDIPSSLVAPMAALAEEQRRTILGGNHRYTRDGKYKPGVTTVIKTMDAPALDKWKVRMQAEGTARAAFNSPPLQHEPVDGYVARMRRLAEEQYEADRVADKAAKIGTEVHALIEHAIKKMLGQPTPEPNVGDEAMFRFAGWKQWARNVGLKPLSTECRVYNSTLDYCGTVDGLVLIEGKPTQLDWKPTDALWAERRLQSAGYRMALMTMGWPEMAGAIVCLPRGGGEISMIPCDAGEDLHEAGKAFAALLLVYRWQLSLKRRERKAA
jgi:hypothetical protein